MNRPAETTELRDLTFIVTLTIAEDDEVGEMDVVNALYQGVGPLSSRDSIFVERQT